MGQHPTSGPLEQGSPSPSKARKQGKTRLHIYIDSEVSAVMDELALNKSKFINKLLRTVLFGEGGDSMFIEFWWSRGPDLNRGPADLQSAATPRLGYRGTLRSARTIIPGAGL